MRARTKERTVAAPQRAQASPRQSASKNLHSAFALHCFWPRCSLFSVKPKQRCKDCANPVQSQACLSSAEVQPVFGEARLLIMTHRRKQKPLHKPAGVSFIIGRNSSRIISRTVRHATDRTCPTPLRKQGTATAIAAPLSLQLLIWLREPSWYE